MPILLINGTIVAEEGLMKADILIDQGRIAAIGAELKTDGHFEVIDCRGKYILPGIIDAHVHFDMPSGSGERTIDDFYSGSIAAACGGVTTVIDYIGPEKGQSPMAAFTQRKKEADGSISVDYGLHYVVNHWSEKYFAQWEELISSGVASFKVFTTYEGALLPYSDILKLLIWSKPQGVLVTVHAEEDRIIKKWRDKLVQEGHIQASFHSKSRPPESETDAVKEIIDLACQADAPVYFVHISTYQAARMISQAQKAGKRILAETCPHYLTLDDDLYAADDPQLYIMCPPLREKSNRPLMWSALKEGVFSVIASDHCAFSREQKLKSDSFFNTPAGIPGVETLLPLTYSYGVGSGQITLTKMVELLSTNPAKLYGLYPRKGVIKTGSDADIVVFNPEKEICLSGEQLHSRSGYSPYHGLSVKGYPEITILRGNLIYREGNFCGKKGLGQFVPGYIFTSK